MRQTAFVLGLLCVTAGFGFAADPSPTVKSASLPTNPEPTRSNVAYGKDSRQVMDFWQAKSGTPAPLVFFIHGGGWIEGDKNDVAAVDRYLAAGISVVSINYRFVPAARAAGVEPPVQWPMHDAARALQFVRSKAREWNIDKARIGAAGGSAGACTGLWLAFHDDMADPASDDPIARESTRLTCVAETAAQTSLDPEQMKEWTPNSIYGGHAFGIQGFPMFLAKREEILPWIQEYSPYALVTADDPPVYMDFPTPPALGRPQPDPTHTSNFGVKLQEKLQGVGVDCELVYPGAPNVKHPHPYEFLTERLLQPAR